MLLVIYKTPSKPVHLPYRQKVSHFPLCSPIRSPTIRVEEAKVAADHARLIPPHNVQAATPAEAYALHDIIPESELNAVPITKLMSAENEEDRLSRLPYRRSEWVQHHISRIFSSQKPSKKLLYVPCLLSFTHQLTCKKENCYVHFSNVVIPISRSPVVQRQGSYGKAIGWISVECR